jgi:sensor c-di-GMP phosphodiesterase-like protein
MCDQAHHLGMKPLIINISNIQNIKFLIQDNLMSSKIYVNKNPITINMNC